MSFPEHLGASHQSKPAICLPICGNCFVRQLWGRQCMGCRVGRSPTGSSVLQLPKPKPQHCSAPETTARHTKKRQGHSDQNTESIQTKEGYSDCCKPAYVSLNAVVATAPGAAVPASLGAFVLDTSLSQLLANQNKQNLMEIQALMCHHLLQL